MNTPALSPAAHARRTALEAENTRAAEARFGRFAVRYQATMADKAVAATYYNGAEGSDLLRLVAYVEEVRASGAYGAVTLYDRLAERHVTRGDVARLYRELGLPVAQRSQ